VLRAREHLAALIARGPVLALELLRYSTELRDPSDLRLPPEDLRAMRIRDQELEMAGRLIEDLAAPWNPEEFKDEYRGELLAFIEKKAKTGGTSPAPAEAARSPRPAPPSDIMALLKRSLSRRSARRKH